MTDEIISTNVSHIRQQIEPLLTELTKKTDIQTASKARSTQGLIVHVYGKLAVAMLLLTPYF